MRRAGIIPVGPLTLGSSTLPSCALLSELGKGTMNLSGRAMGFWQWEWRGSALHHGHLHGELVPEHPAHPQPNATGQQLQPPTVPAPGGVGSTVRASSLKQIFISERKTDGAGDEAGPGGRARGGAGLPAVPAMRPWSRLPAAAQSCPPG